MESAIPEHLVAARSQPRVMPDGYRPPFPAWAARFTPLVEQVVMAYFGVQSRQPLALSALEPATSRFNAADGPAYWDPAHCVDADGYHNLIAIAYWPEVAQFERWRRASGFDDWWNDPAREEEGHGRFLEVVSPTSARFETVFSDRRSPEGVAHLGVGMSDEIQEHGYWGSARDRMPQGQTDSLTGDALPQPAPFDARRVRVPGRDNLCLIRSGQDWSATQASERDKYLHEVEPVLRQGMHFLRDEGDAVGCFSCRYMSVLDAATGAATEKTFGLAHFQDLARLEQWAKSHPTHVAIFGSFMRYVQELNFNIALRLYHEIAAIPADAQHFEYINCHANSGLLQQRDMP